MTKELAGLHATCMEQQRRIQADAQHADQLVSARLCVTRRPAQERSRRPGVRASLPATSPLP